MIDEKLLPSEICPRCDSRIYRAAAQTLRERSQIGGAASPEGHLRPVHFGFQCPQCRAALIVTVLTPAPVTLHFSLQTAGGQS